MREDEKSHTQRNFIAFKGSGTGTGKKLKRVVSARPNRKMKQASTYSTLRNDGDQTAPTDLYSSKKQNTFKDIDEAYQDGIE